MTSPHMPSRWINKLKRGIEWIAYSLFDSAALFFSAPKQTSSSVALVHLELLGDALLWLPYAQVLVQHFKQNNKTIIFVIDARWEELFSTVFRDCVILPISKGSFLHNPKQRWKTLHHLRACQVELVLHPRRQRDYILQDAIVRGLSAPAWGFDSAQPDRPCFDQMSSRRLYHRLLACENDEHVHFQQLAFLQGLSIESKPLPLELPDALSSFIEVDYWVLAPGASQAYRCWPKEHYAEVARLINKRKPSLRCYIVGSKNEHALCADIANLLSGLDVKNMAGTTSVLELVPLIKGARLLIGNDSAAGHIAAAVGTPSVIVTGGGHWGRCFPYPPEAPIRKHPVAVGFPMPCYGCDWQCVHTSRKDKPYPCIEGIRVETVMQAVDDVLTDSAHG